MSEFNDFVKNSREFCDLQDHPMVYSLVLAKLAKGDKAAVKDDTALFNVLNRVEQVIPKIDSTALKTSYSPIAMTALFNKDDTKGALPDYVTQYFNEFEDVAAKQEKSFDAAFEVHKQFSELTKSTEFQNFLKTL